ncbi:MAG TPA: sulfopyruvate decarboxylase subunit alpha [Methanothrix sp.]|nr:sulfopyruvate decarboxylase subunit alpha [Methanothrix sp.]HOK58815.1 sulfopyruvate decarboxylase subunit alpha [Methanothrix sp.]HOL42803.1 sulfopyruvate decarboxylase subunit alpha [Methanothrix sp.]HPO89062.1 sulfopyruvate decarboxylase subunit alpha [Methanothrix sp.]
MFNICPGELVYRGLKRAGINLVASVPCVNLKELLCLLSSDPAIIHMPVTREEEGIGVCAGAYMGGRSPAIAMQNSGLGNSINALASLNMLYGIPLLMVISHRGTQGERLVGQIPMGRLTEPLLKTMGIKFFRPRPHEAEETVEAAWSIALNEKRPVAVLLDIKFWEGR